MMFKLSVLLACLNFWLVSSMTSTGRAGHGLVGYGITMYNPPCAFACRSAISSSPLNCTESSLDMPGHSMMAMGSGETTPECYATDDVFLQTLAWCVSSYCKDIPTWKLEKYWKMNVAGIAAVQPDAKESYQQALAKVSSVPTETLVSGDPLNKTSLVSNDDYMTNWNAMIAFEGVEGSHEKYGLVLLLSGIVIPIAFSLLRFVPWPAHLISKFNAVFIYPPAFGSRHSEATFGFAHVPTRGQAFFITYLIVINVVLSSVGYRSMQPNSWYPGDASKEILTYTTNRLGVLSFANVPLLILYAGRNNVLLYLTNWSHGTFLLLHRWVAFLCTLQAVLHSAIYLQIYVASGEHSSESQLGYWYWGAIATLGMSILLPTSVFPIRAKMYEMFLAWHIALSVLIVAGCYLHILYRFNHQWGYEVWIFVAMAVWGFDRVMRFARIARNGWKTATITVIDDDYVRVDIEGVCGNGHAYLYFPTLTWRVWENHPFSVASTVLPATVQRNHSTKVSAPSIDVEKNGMHKSIDSADPSSIEASSEESLPIIHTKVGMTFLLRTGNGLTSQIRSHTSLPVLVEAPYGSHPDLSEHSLMIGIAGGVGITAVMPYIRAHPGRTKLFWGARTSGIVEATKSTLKGVDKELFVGERMNVIEVLERELSDPTEKAVVVVCGPPTLADDVRMAVSKLGSGKEQVSITLVDEAFSW
ncbi:uncharacterized protein BP5553_06630 [Venustampulla echinocandica]|uniref:Ferric oxidoreductase domain-containing protein n=1 Tax=Venustampulla echinocandica TaxID=2656787 RepID=A0A370TKG5_9HELO|nr:uncharacterized protein BP5553_06630 [Venustampulla echinocandica]RDL36018.1 hypothetical protein BP5553_06630 [Venustampulla echinocandica]